MKLASLLYQLLESNQVPFEEIEHPEAMSSERIAELEHVSGYRFAKPVILAMNEKDLLMAVAPSNYRVYPNKLGAWLGADRIRLATEDEFEWHFPDCELGAMPPFGHLYALPCYVDSSLTYGEYLFFNAGSHRTSIQMKMRYYLAVSGATIASFAAEKNTGIPVV